MSFNTAIRTALQRPSPAFGFWLTLPSTGIAKTVLRSASSSPSGGFDWVLLDAEHGLISDSHYYDLTNTVASEGASPIIRLPGSEDWMIKRALDNGAHGVLIPMCQTVEQARSIVSSCKYPPVGQRGYGPMYAPHAFPGVVPGAQYDRGAQDGLVVAVQIETPSGLESVESIAKVDGLDILLIGPFDLAKQLGVVHGGQEHEAAIARILRATKEAGKTAAIFCSNGAQACARVKQGFDMASVMTDEAVLQSGMIFQLGVARGTAIDARVESSQVY